MNYVSSTEVVYPDAANYALTISEVDIKKIVGVLYFYVPENESISNCFVKLGMYYPEYCQPNFRIDINKVRNGKRIGR